MWKGVRTLPKAPISLLSPCMYCPHPSHVVLPITACTGRILSGVPSVGAGGLERARRHQRHPLQPTLQLHTRPGGCANEMVGTKEPCAVMCRPLMTLHVTAYQFRGIRFLTIECACLLPHHLWPHTFSSCPAHALQGDPVKMQSWSIWGLPKDDVSAANAIIVFEGQRWPLCIDPQGQV